jgi:hypothetical protein
MSGLVAGFKPCLMVPIQIWELGSDFYGAGAELTDSKIEALEQRPIHHPLPGIP